MTAPAPSRTLVWGEGPGAPHLPARTVRALARVGVAAEDVGDSRHALADRLASADGPVWLLREGAWPARPGPVVLPGPSVTGRPLCALGAVRSVAGAGSGDVERWTETLAATGGDLDARRLAPLPPLASLLLDEPLARATGIRLAGGDTLETALEAAARDRHARVVRVAALDVHQGRALRVAQVVTSLQQGGAERIAMDLAAALPRRGLPTLLVALGGPTRAAFPRPAGLLDLSWERHLGREARIGPLLDALAAFGADVVHAHLLDAPELEPLAAGLPLVVTLHNVRAGWPAGTEAVDATLLVACARAVEADARAAGLRPPMRTVWNGVDFSPLERTPALTARAREWRRRLGLAETDAVLVTIANPRPQKRLPVLPRILAATRGALGRHGHARAARLVIAGGGRRDVDREVLAEVDAAARQAGVAGDVRLAGSVDDVPGLLAAADVMVSASAFEGLSLAHVEALAAGLPLVATAVGGTTEIAHGNPAVTLVAEDAPPEAYASAIARALSDLPAGGREAAAHFTLDRMADGYARLYARAAAVHARRGRRGRGLLLVTNNFSTGGAQSSARRLLCGLRARGVAVRAAVLEEQEAWPTPGRRALLSAGIDVIAAPPPAEAEPEDAVAALLARVDADPPAAVLFWNAMPAHKVLLVDALLDVPVYDVSPGEMYYESLERYFARSRPGRPYRTPADYGARLAGVVVKYGGEAERATRTLGVPVHVIPNGVAVPEPEGARDSGGGGPLVIGTLARLDPRKKVHELLEALTAANGRLPPHVLRVAGGVERGCADYAEELRRQAAGTPVEWTGDVEDAAPFLRGLDVFALVAEPAGCPNASLEAMAAGLPVVATDVGGMSEQVVDGITGHMVPAGDPEAMAAALVRLAGDAEARSRLGEAGRARIRERFGLDRMVDAYRRVCLAQSLHLSEGAGDVSNPAPAKELFR